MTNNRDFFLINTSFKEILIALKIFNTNYVKKN